jgi:DNA-binding MurR/RpiR family transcriptional regulator
LGVDPATITRFAQRLGYAGYPELLLEIQTMVKKELKIAYKPPAEEDDEGLFLRALAHEKANLERAITHAKGEAIAEVISALRAARRIYVVAQGLAMGPAQVFVAHLHGLLGMSTQLVTAESLAAPVNLSSLTGDDVVMGISLSALQDDTAQMLRLAKSRGAKTIGLAASHTSPTASISELILVYPSESTTDIPSVVCLTAILASIFQVIALREPEQISRLKEGLQRNLNWLWEDKGEKRIQDADILRQV